MRGIIEWISPYCVAGWSSLPIDVEGFEYVCARISGKIIGIGKSEGNRDDLDNLPYRARTFLIQFDKSIDPSDLSRVEVRCMHDNQEIFFGARLRIDNHQGLQIFIVGSPRSGTSELAFTLHNELKLSWLGECHGAPQLSRAANEITGRADSESFFDKFFFEQKYREIFIEITKKAYFKIHNSSSFIDKTPGHEMISSCIFLNECFPTAKFIYMKRNGISNILSRLKKFGGNFEEHCHDWVRSMQCWSEVRPHLSSFLEIDQGDMRRDPHNIAYILAKYVGVPDAEHGIARSLSTGFQEYTGAGLYRERLDDTNWSDGEREAFLRICGPTMISAGYQI